MPRGEPQGAWAAATRHVSARSPRAPARRDAWMQRARVISRGTVLPRQVIAPRPVLTLLLIWDRSSSRDVTAGLQRRLLSPILASAPASRCRAALNTHFTPPQPRPAARRARRPTPTPAAPPRLPPPPTAPTWARCSPPSASRAAARLRLATTWGWSTAPWMPSPRSWASPATRRCRAW